MKHAGGRASAKGMTARYAAGDRPLRPAREILTTSDGGGSNSSRSRLWKVALQAFADRTNLAVSVSHLPPGTSKWNKIEHCLFSHISQNWRGRPLVSHETIVNLIAGTTTRTGLKVRAKLDRRRYPVGTVIDDAELATLPRRADLRTQLIA